MPRLIVEQGKDSGAELLVVGTLTAGRDPACALALHDRQASRHHCRFEDQNGRLIVKDLGSRNGILVNGARVAEAELKVGDRVSVGGAVLRVAEGILGPWSGKTVCGYRILDKIGEGGMGEVYRAEQLSMHRFVAVKVLSARLREDPRYVERLLKEARAAAQLNHPGLIQVHDVLQTEEITFFSMELVQGKTLRDLLRRGALGIPQVLTVAKAVLEALKYAHAKGIVHHDVKPENVMMGEDGRVKLADLGIAQPLGAQLSTAGEGGRKRTLLGTPHYMPPDQVTADRVDPRFDLYALGATCYHALGGRAPYRGGSAEEIVKQVCAGPPPPLASLAPSAPPEVLSFVERLMARDPAARTPSAEQALKELAPLQAKYGETEAGTGSPTRGGTITGSLPAPGRLPRQAAYAAFGLLVLAGIFWGSKALAQRFLPAKVRPDITPAPPVGNTRKAPPDRSAALLGKGDAAREAGDLEAAQAAYQGLLDLNLFDGRYPLDRAKAQEGLAWIETERARRRLEADWASFQASLRGLTEDSQLERLNAFLLEHPDNPHLPEARERIRGIEEARAAAQEAARLAEADAEMEAARRLAENPGGSRTHAAMEKLRAFRDSRPGLPAGKLKEIRDLEQAFAARRQAIWDEAQRRSRTLAEQREFAGARRELEALAAIPGEQWEEPLRIPLANLDKAVRAYAEEAFQEASGKLDRFEAQSAEAVLARAVRALEGTPLAGRALALHERARILGEAHGAVVDRINAHQGRDFALVVRVGAGKVDAATAEDVTVSLDEGGGTTKAAWKDLPAATCLGIYRHYLDLKQPQSRLRIFCFCWQRGLWKEAAEEAERAEDTLKEHPGMAEAFSAERPR